MVLNSGSEIMVVFSYRGNTLQLWVNVRLIVEGIDRAEGIDKVHEQRAGSSQLTALRRCRVCLGLWPKADYNG